MKQNLSIYLMTRYFAKWSTPYQSPFSNVSRILLPFSDVINANIEKAANMLSMKYRNNLLDTYDTLHLINRFGEFKEIRAESSNVQNKDGTFTAIGNVKLTNVGHVLFSSWSQFQVNGVSLIRPNFNWKGDMFSVSISPGINKLNYRFVGVNRLYFKIPVRLIEDSYISVSGYNNKFQYITERISVRYAGVYESFNKFLLVDNIQSPADIKLSNFIDCSIDHSVISKNSINNRITNKDGLFISPILSVNNKTIYIRDSSSSELDPIGQMDLNYTPKLMFLSGSSDLYIVDNSKWLITCKPTLNISTQTLSDGSNNNNKFVFIEEGEHSSGSVIRCKVLAHEIAKHSSSSLIRISVRSGDDVYYVNSKGALVENPDTWIDAYKASSIISVPVICDSESPYIFTVNNVEGESYSCSVAQMFSEQISILGDVSDMYVYNSELFLTYKDELFMVKPLRHVYANYSSNTTTLDYGYKKLEVK